MAIWPECEEARNLNATLALCTLSVSRKSKQLGNTTFREVDLFPSSSEGGRFRPLSCSLPEEANRLSFRNVFRETSDCTETRDETGYLVDCPVNVQSQP
jgi:hypothetical protein